jgi:two-component system sensor histidine kinase UhpB
MSSIRIDVQCAFKQRLRPEIEVALYRVVQEALTNAAKHSSATLVTVAMVRERSVVRCEIRDDGGGFDVAAISAPSGKRGLVLLGMRERVAAVAGSLQFDSVPGQGTRILVSVPVPDCARPSEAG